jgi:hypothetical protein
MPPSSESGRGYPHCRQKVCLNVRRDRGGDVLSMANELFRLGFQCTDSEFPFEIDGGETLVDLGEDGAGLVLQCLSKMCIDR